MKTTPLLLLVLWLLGFGATQLSAQTSSVATVEENGPRSQRINLVFLSEGYTSSQMGTFANDVQTTVDFLFSREPWVRYRPYCNIYRIEIASTESGTDSTYQPRTIPSIPVAQRNTYFDTGFVTDNIDRLLTIPSSGSTRAYALLNRHVPEYDIPIMLVNDSAYGGSGGPIAVASTNFYSAGIVEHELGHSYVGLTDEYDEATPGYPATEFANATTQTARANIRWNIWIEPTTPLPTPEGNIAFGLANPLLGLYEGANYRSVGWYRPHDNALMRSLLQPPGSVTREAIVLKYYSKVSPLVGFTPATLSLTYTSQVLLSFNATPMVPATSPALTVEWQVGGVPQTTVGPTFNLPSKNLGNGTFKIKAIVRDPTAWVRRDTSGRLAKSVEWTVKLSNQSDPPFTLVNPLPPLVVKPVFSEITLNATANGPGPFIYQWSKNDKPLNIPTSQATLALTPTQLTDAGTYSVKISNATSTVTHRVVVALFDPDHTVNRVAVGQSRTATLSLAASTNLPAVAWTFGANILANGTRYALATTKTIQIKGLTLADTGHYYYDFPTPTGLVRGASIHLQVVTAKPAYTTVNLTLPPSIVGGAYNDSFPYPTDVLQTPNAFGAKLPAGLILNTRTGAISGTPTAASKDQVNGDKVVFTVGNEFGKVQIETRLLVKALPPGMAGNYNGPIPANIDGFGGETGGRADLTVSASSAVTGTVTVGALTRSIKGTLSVGSLNPEYATAFITVAPSGALAGQTFYCNIHNAGDTDPTTWSILGQEFPNPSLGFSAWRNKWAPPESLDPFRGYYTFSFGYAAGAAPQAHGYGFITVDATGVAKVNGRLADGESFACTSYIGPDGEILLYRNLYSTPKPGSLLGVMKLESSLGTALGGDDSIRWVRPRDDRASARTYRAGFGPVNITPYGGRYTPPAPGQIVLGWPVATGTPAKNVVLSFASFSETDPAGVGAAVDLELKADGTVRVNAPNPKNVTFSYNRLTGEFSGFYTTKDNDPRPAPPARPQITRKVEFRGILSFPYGFGYFLRDALPRPANGTIPATTPSTSPREAGWVFLVPTNNG